MKLNNYWNNMSKDFVFRTSFIHSKLTKLMLLEHMSQFSSDFIERSLPSFRNRLEIISIWRKGLMVLVYQLCHDIAVSFGNLIRPNQLCCDINCIFDKSHL